MKPRTILFTCTLVLSLALEYYVRAYNNWHQLGNHMDSVMHFFWGLNIFLAFVVLLRWKPASALYGVFAVQMNWELLEMIGDYVIIQPDNMLDIFWWDGVKDTVLDLLGGVFGWFLLKSLPGGLQGLRETKWKSALRLYPALMAPGIVIGGIIWFLTGSSPQVFAIVWIAVAGVIAVWKN